MAGLYFNASSGEVALVASTAKSVLQIKAATNQRVLIHKITTFGKQPAGGTDTPTKIRMTRNSASFGTFSAGITNKRNPSDGETLQTTVGTNASVEPTTPTDGAMYWEINPQTGYAEPDIPTQEIEIPGGQSVQFEFTATATPTVTINCLCQE